MYNIRTCIVNVARFECIYRH